MLRYLKVSNLAIIDEVEVEFREGFNVLTGETGAGKSILIGALNLLLGAKVSPDIIRTGEDEAHVEGLFELPQHISLTEDLDEALGKERELVVARRLFRTGRSRCFINGSLATQSTLQSLATCLISIFGQHEHHDLLDAHEHIDRLDRFGALHDLRRATAEAHGEWKRSVTDYDNTGRRLAELEKAQQENTDAIEELTEAALQPGEEEELKQERDVLSKAVQIRERAYEAYQLVYSRSGSIVESFSDVKKAVAFLTSANPKLSGLAETLDDIVYRVEDLGQELRRAAEAAESDPMRLDRIEERLAVIRRLKRKYGTDLEGLLAQLEDLSNEAGEILDLRSQVKKLEESVQKNREAYVKAARKLTKARKKAAKELEASMKEEIKDLAMPEAKLLVKFEEFEEKRGTASGLETAQFLLSSNPGEAPRPLARIASGGELSRIMLALKALEIDTEGASTVIFDEVDAGIGGRTANAVGARLAKVAERQQVLCITHLHQIAALANHHLSVRKSVKSGRTSIEVRPLDQDARLEELTRMIGASPQSDSVKDHLQSLIDTSAAEVQS